MKAIKLYQQLEKDFIKKGLSDDWLEETRPIKEFFTDNFKQRSMGIVCDFAKEITKVYTAVFASNKVMKAVLADKAKDSLLFVHHPAVWDIRKTKKVFQPIDKKLLQLFRNNRVSIYNLHVPLDNFGKYSTSVTLAKTLNIKIDKSFASYHGSLCGIIGKTNLATIDQLKELFEKSMGHRISCYNYGSNKINNQTIAIVAGGGNEIDILREIKNNKINAFVTGITTKNNYSKKCHDFAEKNKINILGGTHYSTEKFAVISMVDYFKKLGLTSEFIADKPIMEDM